MVNAGLAVVTGLFMNMFFHQYAPKIIGSRQKPQLSGRNILRKPGGLNVGKVVQQ